MEFWTKPKFYFRDLFGGVDAKDIEIYVENNIFRGSHVVLFPSARMGIQVILNYLGAARGTNVLVSKFSSHCLWSSIGLVANPTSVYGPGIDFVLNFRGEFDNLIENTKYFIDDNVDSFYLEQELQIKRLTIISLPKIIASLGGALILCPDRKTKDSLVIHREQYSKRHLASYLRVMSYFFSPIHTIWSFLEPLGISFNPILLRNIYSNLQEYKKYEIRRKSHLKTLGLEHSDILPNYLAVIYSEGVESKYSAYLGNRQRRNVWDVTSSQMVKAWICPIHHQVSNEQISNLKKVLENETVRYLF